jgi:hypothetical protein
MICKAVELFEKIQLGFSGHSENWPIESGLVPAQLVSKVKKNIMQVALVEYDSRVSINAIKLQLLSVSVLRNFVKNNE